MGHRHRRTVMVIQRNWIRKISDKSSLFVLDGRENENVIGHLEFTVHRLHHLHNLLLLLLSNDSNSYFGHLPGFTYTLHIIFHDEEYHSLDIIIFFSFCFVFSVDVRHCMVYGVRRQKKTKQFHWMAVNFCPYVLVGRTKRVLDLL